MFFYIPIGMPPPIPIPPAGIGGVSSFLLGRSVTAASVVSIIAAADEAFSRPAFTTFRGSMIPELTMFTYLSFRASYPIPFCLDLMFSMTTDPSLPAIQSHYHQGGQQTESTRVHPVPYRHGKTGIHTKIIHRRTQTEQTFDGFICTHP